MKLFLKFRYAILITCAILTSLYPVHAQITESGFPESFLTNLKDATIIPSYKLDSVQVEKRLTEDKELHIDNRYGVVQQCNINIKEAGVRTEIRGKGTIWRYKIESDDAFSLGLYFKNYRLPQGARIFIYDTSHIHLRGAFTKRNNNSRSQLPIADFPGRNMVIEYFEPTVPEFDGELVIGGITQAYTDLKAANLGRLGINCPQGAMWKKEKNSVCLMTFHDWNFSYICSGALINNSRNDQTPYFLTANHCIRSEFIANTLITYFNFENSACNTYDASSDQTVAGASIKATSNYTDFSLLLLAESPPDEYNAFYAGWDVSGEEPEWGVCIHHPHGLPKGIAIDSLPIYSFKDKVQWITDGLRLYSTTLPHTHWGMEFDQGSVESGSSGAPFFDQNKRIVGQLHGGAGFVLLFGKLSLSWNFHPEHSKQLAYWLDPEHTTKVLDGIWKIPPKALFRSQLQQVCPNTPVLFYDQSTQNPIAWKWKVSPSTYSFVNGTDSTSQNPQIAFLEEGPYAISLQTTNKYGSDTVSLSNYIIAKKQLNVKFNRLDNENVICGCDLKAYLMMAGGAVKYNYNIDRPDLIHITSNADSVFMTLDPAVIINNSFDTWIKVTGTNGICSATDSMLLHIIIQPNDHMVNAASLHLGRNTGFSNFCATAEKNEPHPHAIGCSAPESWCPNLMGNYNIINNSVWFTFIPPSEGAVTINTNGFDDQIAVYEQWIDYKVYPESKIEYTLLAANDNRSNDDQASLIENLQLIPGKKYLLQVDGNNGAYGDLVIDLISNSLEVAPNPSTGIFHIIISNPAQGLARVIVSDLNGATLFENLYNINLSNNKLDIDLTNFTRGIYILNVQINNSKLSKKLVKW